VQGPNTDAEGWRYANAFWLLDEADGALPLANAQTGSVRRRLWRRRVVMVKDPSSSCLQQFKMHARHPTTANELVASPRVDDLYSRLTHVPHASHGRGRGSSVMGPSPVLERQTTAGTDRSAGHEAPATRARVLPASATGKNLLQCLGFYQGGLRIPYDKVLRVTVLSPTTVKLTLSVEVVGRTRARPSAQ
jgi:hypothetical protein